MTHNENLDMDELTLQQVEQLAAQQGITFGKADFNKISRAREAERARIKRELEAAADSAEETWADAFRRWYPKLLQAIVSAGNIVITLSQTLIVNLGVPVVLVLLMIVEQRRVWHGIELFEVNAALASFAAWSLVVLNLVLEMIAHHIEYTGGYESERRKRWSLRIWLANMAYRLGIGEDWREQSLSPAQWAHNLLRIVTVTILALALAGSMRIVIEQQSGPWYDALVAIMTQSTLIDMLTWLGGLMFAAAAVLSAQGLSRYVAIRTVEIRAEMFGETDDDSEQLDRAAAIAAYGILISKIQKKKAKDGNFTTPLVEFSTNGAKNHQRI
jgi:hypothetical protein